MWTSTSADKWTRSDNDQGYLLQDGDTMLELHGDTVHVYRKDPNADPATFTGGPLDGYIWQSTEPADAKPAVPADPATAWQLLSDKAAQVDATLPSSNVDVPPPATA